MGKEKDSFAEVTQKTKWFAKLSNLCENGRYSFIRLKLQMVKVTH